MKTNREHHVKRIDYAIEVHGSICNRTVLFDDRDFIEEEGVEEILRKGHMHNNIIICSTDAYEIVFRSVLNKDTLDI